MEETAANSTDSDLVNVVVEAETAVQKARAAVEAARINGYELLPVHIEEFESILSEMTQVWLVSGRQFLLPPAVISSLARAHNEEGLGLHVMGDNEPYIYDANELLKSVFAGTGGSVTLRGNYLSSGYVMGPVGDDFAVMGAAMGAGTSVSAKVRGGFLRDPSCKFTIGVEYLHSGVTVSDVTFGPESGLIPVIRSTDMHSAPLVCTLAFRPAVGLRGGLVVNGAFTTLLRSIWLQAAGAGRLYANVASVLSMQPEDVKDDGEDGGGGGGDGASDGVNWAAVKGAPKDTATGLCTTGGFAGTCAVSEFVCIPWHPASAPETPAVRTVCAEYESQPGDATCSVLFFAWSALSKQEREAMRTDFAFNNPVAAGAANGAAAASPFVFSEAYLSLASSNRFAQKPNTCPFTRRHWETYLPLVALAPDSAAPDSAATLAAGFAHNARRVKEFADKVFFGGPQSGKTSLLMLAGALWEMLRRMQAGRSSASKEERDEIDEQTLVTVRALEYMLRQLVAHIGCAPNMTAVGTGVRVPLFTAFLQYCAADQTSFCPAQVACLVDLVLRFGCRWPNDDERSNMLRTVRRAFIIQQLAAVCDAAKKQGLTNYDFFVKAARGLVGFAPGTNLVDVTQPAEVLEHWGFCTISRGAPSSVDYRELLKRDFGGVDPVSDLVARMVGACVLRDAFAHWWLGKTFPASQHPFLCKTSAAIDRWRKENPTFEALWNCADCAGKAPLTAGDVQAAIHAAVAAHLSSITFDGQLPVPFASCFGPSALRCAYCGSEFATLGQAQDLVGGDSADMHRLRAEVVKHLHSHGVVSSSGSCNNTTAGGSLHLFVQLQMSQPANRSARDADDADDVRRIADAVQHALVRDRQGTESLVPSVTRAPLEALIRGYMRLRDAGAEEPALRADGTFGILFVDKLRAELNVLRTGIGVETGDAVDGCAGGGTGGGAHGTGGGADDTGGGADATGKVGGGK